MENFNLYNQVSSPYFGVIIAIIIILPLLLIATIFRPKYKNDKKIKKNKLFNISNVLRIVSFILCIVILCIFRDSYDIKITNIWFGIMLFFYVLYYELVIRYIIRGRRQKDLYKPFMYVKVPIAICISGGILFTSIWSKNIYLIISSIIFCISNVYVSYITYYNKFVEYRDLYDEKRNLVNKRVIRDGKVPKGLKYVTVVVFIYNKYTKEWLMQKRSKDKGGKWATTSGHPISGQTSIEGMVTEIKEELGLSIKENELKFITTVNRKEKFADIYYLEKDVDLKELNIQKEELDDIKWMTQKEIEELYKIGKFKKTHYNYYHELLKCMNNK